MSAHGKRFLVAGCAVLTAVSGAASTTTARAVGTTGDEPSPDAAGTRPNILIINTDDQRSTGTLDVMPKVRAFFQDHGTTFINGEVTTPLCTPSRSSLFSGRYSHNTGITANGLPDQVAAFDQSATLQAYLQNSGYNTAMVGKFLNTYPLTRNPEHWNHWATTTGGYYDVPFNVDGKYQKTSGYYSPHVAQYAKSFLQDFEATDAKPWLMYIAPEAPHADYEPSPKYQNAPVPAPVKPPSWNEADVSDKPPPIQQRALRTEADYTYVRTQMLRTLMSVDDMTGSVIKQLRSLGELSNTIAIYMGDNGFLWAEHRVIDKRFPYLESTDVPFLMRWPGHIAAGATSTRLVTQMDLMPTLLEAAGVQPTLTHPLDGQSILSAPPRSQVYLEYFKSSDSPLGPWAALRGDGWQYTEWYDTTSGAITFREYYDLVADPYQLTNLLADGNPGNNPDVSALHHQLTAARSCVGADCP